MDLLFGVVSILTELSFLFAIAIPKRCNMAPDAGV